MSIRVFLSFWVAIFVLTSCTNTTNPKPKVKTTITPVETLTVLQDSQYYLQQARQGFEKNKNVEHRNSLLIKAGEMLLLEQKYVQSINLLNVLLPELSTQKQLSQAYLTLAEAYFADSKKHAKLSAELLAKVRKEDVSPSRVALLRSSLMFHKSEWLDGADELLNTVLTDNNKSEQIWKAISHLTLAELEKARWQHQKLQPWIQLAVITQKHALKPESLSQHILKWQSEHVGHPLQQNLPFDVVQALDIEPITPKRVAVLLPLTGRLSSQGTVLKDGFLAAYLKDKNNYATKTKQHLNTGAQLKQEDPALEVHFFDSALKTSAELNELVADYDVIVGPLLKEKILGLSEILPNDKIMLALNRVDAPPINDSLIAITNEDNTKIKEHYYFSLAPEDEAEQLAKYIHHKQLSRPIVFAANNNTTERMAQAFVKQWQTFPEAVQPEVIVFKDNKDMRRQVSETLDVEQSKKRIKTIEYLSNVEVIGQERNRRDIDAIVIFANPEETALLNPIIEASLSSFAEISLSVFASSRSYTQKQTEGSLRDLRNLTFSDMPLLLPEHKWPNLSKQINQLWPQRTDSLLRLFAMGYDAYNFIPQLRQLKALPQISSQGITGEISLVSDVIKRKLPLAKVVRNKVILLEMD